MKILHIINSLATGGAEKLLLETLPLYQQRGIQIDLLVLNGTTYPFTEKLKELNYCSIFSLGKDSVYNPLNILKIIPYLKKYDLIHVHLFPAQYWVVFAKLISFSKTKLIFTEHSTSNKRLKGTILKKIDRFIYRFYNATICITYSIKEILLKHTKMDSEKFCIIENGVNLKNIHAAIPYQKQVISTTLKSDDLLLIHVAGFKEPKDQFTVIRAVSLLPENIKLLLVGDGEFKIECEYLVSQLQLWQRVIFLGIRMDVPRLLKSSDIIILSSKYEGLSLSSIEGMASGKPFLASDVPGLREIVTGAGILFPQGDDQKLAEEIKKLIEDKEYSNRVSARCVERASNYDIKNMVDQTIDLYKKILNK